MKLRPPTFSGWKLVQVQVVYLPEKNLEQKLVNFLDAETPKIHLYLIQALNWRVKGAKEDCEYFRVLVHAPDAGQHQTQRVSRRDNQGTITLNGPSM